MHFIGRYVEAQKNRWAEAIWNNSALCNQLNIKPPVYIFGIQYLDENGKVKVKCPNGYAYNLHAEDILIYATKAFKELGRDEMCLYKIEDDNYHSIFIRKNYGILTLYPNLTPKYDTNCSYSLAIYLF